MPGKKKTPIAQSLDQASFLRALDKVEGWDRICASEDEITYLAERLTSTDEATTYQKLFSDVNVYAANLRKAAQNQDWDKVDARLLTILVCGGEAVQRGMRLCLPASLASVSDVHRIALFLAIVHSRAARMGIDPLPWIDLVVLLRVLAPHAIHEISQRTKKHVGVLYGLAAYLWNRPEAEGELQTLLKDVRLLSNEHVHDPNVRHVLKQRSQSNQTHERPLDVVPEITSALARILDQKRLLDDPLNSLVESLNERLNILPTSVGNQVTKDVMPKRRYREIPIEITNDDFEREFGTMHINDNDLSDVAERSLFQPVPMPLDVLINDDVDHEQERLIARVAAEVQRLCAEKAKYRVGYEAFTKQGTKRELAKKYRKDPDTIGRWEKNFVAKLRESLVRRKP